MGVIVGIRTFGYSKIASLVETSSGFSLVIYHGKP
jgi:hypothetical protein